MYEKEKIDNSNPLHLLKRITSGSTTYKDTRWLYLIITIVFVGGILLDRLFF
jgi:hypothetical protein